MGVYEEETIDNTIETLERAIELYSKPKKILTDHGTQFFSNGKNGISVIRISSRSILITVKSNTYWVEITPKQMESWKD